MVTRLEILNVYCKKMKRIGFMTFIMLASLSVAFAQQIAVLDFKAGAGINQSDVDGISAMFTTYFYPRGYTIVERTQVDQVLRQQGLQGSSFTEDAIVRIGQILNVNKIVVGDVNIVSGQYNVDVRVVDVQGAYVTGRDGATFPQGTNYRETMKKLAERVASQIAIVSGTTGYSQSGKSPSGKVETILGYLQVYPEDLGSFNGIPSSVIAAVNRQKLNGYGDWRLPTNEELSLMATAKVKLGMGNLNGYMSYENAYSGEMKIVRLVRSNAMDNGNSLPIDPNTKKITFRKVINTIGSQNEVFNRIFCNFISIYYQGPQTILQQNDGRIMKGKHQFQLDNGDPVKSKWPWITYYFTIEVREGRVRYTLTDFMQKTQSDHPCEEWMNKEDPLYQPIWDSYLNQIGAFGENWGQKFEEGLIP